MLVKKLTAQRKFSFKDWLKKAKSALLIKCQQNLAAILVVLATFISLSLLMSSLDTRDNRVSLATTLLCLDYLILVILIIAHNQYFKSLLGLPSKDNEHKTKRITQFYLTWFAQHNVAFSFALALSTLLIFEAVHNINLIYKLTLAFCFALILFRVVLFFTEKLQVLPQSLDLKSQKIYIIYAGIIALSFFSATTVDNSDYGTEFQLTILSWLMLFHLLSWIMIMHSNRLLLVICFILDPQLMIQYVRDH